MIPDQNDEVVTMEAGNFISRRDDVMSGALVFAGTRVPVEALFGNLTDGMSISDFSENFPSVTREQVEAVLALAAEDMQRRVA